MNYSTTLVLNSRVLLLYTDTVKELPGYPVQNSPSGSFLSCGGAWQQGGNSIWYCLNGMPQKEILDNVRTPVCFRILSSSLTSVSIFSVCCYSIVYKEVNKEQPSYRNLSATATRVLQCTCPVAASRKYFSAIHTSPHLTSTHLTPDYANTIILHLVSVLYTAVNDWNKN